MGENRDIMLYRVTPYYNFMAKNSRRLFVERQVRPYVVEIDLGNDDSNMVAVSPYRIINKTNGKELPRLKHSLWDGMGGNLENISSARQQISGSEGSLTYILIDAIECLSDPRALLACLRSACIDNNAKVRLIVPVKRPSHNALAFRTYKTQELVDLFTASGFEVDRSSDGIIATCGSNGYQNFLTSNNMPSSGIIRLALTTEHPDYRITGGIGSYIKESQTHYGDVSAIMVVDTNDKYTPEPIEKFCWLSPQKLLSVSAVERMMNTDHGFYGDALLAAIQHTLFYYPHLRIVELSDYGSLSGDRIIQAKEAGLLPSELQLITVCHGSTLYTTNAAREFIAPSAIPTMLREAYSIENADKTIYLTDFLRKLYEGHGLKSRIPLKDRLPLHYEDIPSFEGDFSSRCKRLIYIGKPTKMKGFDLFLSTVLCLLKSPSRVSAQIEEIVCFTTFTEVPDPVIECLMAEVRDLVRLEIVSLPRTELFRQLQVFAQDSLALVTYGADNHPNVVLELMSIGCDFVAANSGGIPELLNEKTKLNFLAEPTPDDFVEKVQVALKDRKARSSLCSANRRWYLAQQEKINRSYNRKKLKTLGIDMQPHRYLEAGGDKATVVVPVYNTDLDQVRQLCVSLKNQSVTPSEVIFVNDGSSLKNYDAMLRSLIKECYPYRYRVVTKENGGLSSARNEGLRTAQTDYIITIDSDDLVSNYYVENLVRAKDANPDAVAVTPYLSDFIDGKSDPAIYNPEAYEYHPTGSSLATAFFPSNFFGSAAAIFDRKELLAATGGWDQTDKSMWEDWALYVKLRCQGKKIAILPEVNYFYRVRQDSMVRTYSKQQGAQRLIRNFTALPHFDSYLLYSQMKYIDDIGNGVYPLEIWNPITEHARREALRQFERKYHIDTIRAFYLRHRSRGARIKNKLMGRSGNKNA